MKILAGVFRLAVSLTVLMVAGCAPEGGGGATLDVSVSLRPAMDRGYGVTRGEVVLTDGGDSLKQSLAVDAQGESATARFGEIEAGRYKIDVRLFDQALLIGGGSGLVTLAPGSSQSAVVIFANFESTFLMNLAARTGLPFDLPTEAQWEYACRAGARRAYNNDKDCLTAEMDDKKADANLEPLAWYGHNWPGQASGIGTREVGTKQPNAWGLYDMHGNVWELCLDWFGGTLSDATDPVGPSSGKKRVARGGSYHAWPAICRSAQRMPAREQFQATGFRLVCPEGKGQDSRPYMIVDLSGGASAERYPVEYLDAVPEDLTANADYRKTRLVLRRVPPGTFVMGSPADETGRGENEAQHSVTLTKGFYIGVFEVTQGQWQAVMGANPSRFIGDELPVETITWQDDIRGGSWPPRP